MNASTESMAAQVELRPQRFMLWLAYLMYVLVVPAVVGYGLATWQSHKLAQERGLSGAGTRMMLITHHEWLKRTFVAGLFFGLAAVGTAYYGFGYLIGAGIIVWCIYRVLRGLLSLMIDKPVPVSL